MVTNKIALTRVDSLQAYIQQINTIPLLTQEEEIDLTNKWWKKADVAAVQKLVLSHLRLVVKIAQGFRSYEMPMQDVISEGNIGLMKAVQKFSPAMGCRLSTYAAWWIKAAIQGYILKSWSMMKVSTAVMKKKLFCKLNEVKEKISTLGTKMIGGDTLELSDLQTTSLDQDNENGNISAINSSHEDFIIDFTDKNAKAKVLKGAIEKLSDREKDILYSRHLKDKPDTLSFLAQKYGVSNERIRQIEERIIVKLRTMVISASV